MVKFFIVCALFRTGFRATTATTGVKCYISLSLLNVQGDIKGHVDL